MANKHTPGQLCTKCGLPSIKGLRPGCGKCEYHWAEGNWGTDWAAKCHPDHPEAKAHARAAITKATS